jgi:alpha-tubulin suppressor-like RCC1 family protein
VYLPLLIRDLTYDSEVQQISAGDAHSLAVCLTTASGGKRQEDTVYSWGEGANGRLGLCRTAYGTDPKTRLLPQRIRYLNNKGVISVSAGGAHSIALVGSKGISGKIWVWGEGRDGQLGNDFAFEIHRPQYQKNGKFNIKKVVAARRHTVAITVSHQ